MNRIGSLQPIDQALALIPPRIRERVRCDFLTGADAVFAGLHEYERTEDGRSYRDTAHAYEHHTADKTLTVVLPDDETIITVVHELGHVLDANIHWNRPTPKPVSDYAETDRYEAFAEAFSLWIAPSEFIERDPSARPEVLAQDEQTRALFEELARA